MVFLDTWKKIDRGDTGEQALKVVTRFTKNDPITLTPLADFVWDEIEKTCGEVYAQHDSKGFKYIIAFPESEYSLCIMKTNLSVGHVNNEYEAVVLDLDYHPCYDTDFGHDSIGWLTDGDLLSLIRLVSRFDDDGKIRK